MFTILVSLYALIVSTANVHAIEFGSDDTQDVFKRVGAVFSESGLCWGTLVKANIVLTAAHCFDGQLTSSDKTFFILNPALAQLDTRYPTPLRELWLKHKTLGTIKLDERHRNTSIFEVEKIVVHPRYKYWDSLNEGISVTHEWSLLRHLGWDPFASTPREAAEEVATDFALLKLPAPVGDSYLRPTFTLAQKFTMRNKSAIVELGSGERPFQRSSRLLQYDADHEGYWDSYERSRKVINGVPLAQFSSQTSCRGDSGGPAFTAGRKGLEIIGVASWFLATTDSEKRQYANRKAQEDGQARCASSLSFASVFYQRDWIQQTILELEGP